MAYEQRCIQHQFPLQADSQKAKGSALAPTTIFQAIHNNSTIVAMLTSLCVALKL